MNCYTRFGTVRGLYVRLRFKKVVMYAEFVYN